MNDRFPGERIESDSMGSLAVPSDAYYGASTQRAVDNFPLSGLRFTRRFIRALGLIKWGAALVNQQLGFLEGRVADAIAAAALQVATGELDDHFPVDVFQTGSGTSTNMNANEVIANRAIEILGGERGSKEPVHPNDHVNRGQSSNDVIPTAIHLSALIALYEVLFPAIRILRQDLEAKKTDLWNVVKIGRTHLQDATPIRLGQVFEGYAGQMARAERRLAHARDELSEVALGGTAVGTGLNSHPEFAGRVCDLVSDKAGVTIRETENHFQAQATLDAAVAASGCIRTAAVSLLKLANDIRWLASGPRCGLGELEIPAVQPGSSIMPGKVNPVIAEALIQASCQVIANDSAIVQGGTWGFFELNTMMPLVAHNLLGSIELLGAATQNFSEKCVRGIQATEAGARGVERSLALATALVPVIGYDAAVGIAQEAALTGKTVRDVARNRTDLTKSQLDEMLDPLAMTNPTTPP
jgi:fumarate hydratase class II